jgi:DNA-binding beta-propeller fold protein YncE
MPVSAPSLALRTLLVEYSAMSNRARTLSIATVAAGLVAASAVLAAPAAPSTAFVATTATAAHPSRLDRIELPTGFRPEGITSGPGSRFYAGSLADGALYAGDLRTGTGSVILPGAPGRRLVGLFFDRRSGFVWAAGAQGTDGTVWAIDGASGTVRATIPVPGAGFLNDLVATREAVWVTDSAVDRLARIALDRRGRPTGADPTFAPLTGSWPTAGAFRANGIRALPDGSLLVDHSSAGGLWRFVPATGAVAPVPVTGTPAVVSGDGMELRGDTLYVVRGSGGPDVTVLRLDRRADGWSARVTGVLSSGGLDVPSTATLALGSLWAVNARFGTVPDPTTAEYWVTRLPMPHRR